MSESIESLKSNREILLDLEKTGKYLFHGSPWVLEQLEPRQAKRFNEEKSEMVDDGEPAVISSPFADIAIFRSVVNREHVKIDYMSSFSYQDGGLSFSLNQNTMEKIKDSIGYVYVFNKDDFDYYSPMEYRSKKIIIPIDVIKVSFGDLPPRIEIKN